MCAIEHASEVCALRLFYFGFGTPFYFERGSANGHMQWHKILSIHKILNTSPTE